MLMKASVGPEIKSFLMRKQLDIVTRKKDEDKLSRVKYEKVHNLYQRYRI